MVTPASPQFVLGLNNKPETGPRSSALERSLRRSETLVQDPNSKEQAGKNQAESGRKQVDLLWQRREKQIRDRRVCVPFRASTFAAVEQSLPQYLKFFIPHHLFIL